MKRIKKIASLGNISEAIGNCTSYRRAIRIVNTKVQPIIHGQFALACNHSKNSVNISEKDIPAVQHSAQVFGDGIGYAFLSSLQRGASRSAQWYGCSSQTAVCSVSLPAGESETKGWVEIAPFGCFYKRIGF